MNLEQFPLANEAKQNILIKEACVASIIRREDNQEAANSEDRKMSR